MLQAKSNPQLVWDSLPTSTQENIIGILAVNSRDSRRYTKMATNLILGYTNTTPEVAIAVIAAVYSEFVIRMAEEELFETRLKWGLAFKGATARCARVR